MVFIVTDREGKHEREFKNFGEAIADFYGRIEKSKKEHYLIYKKKDFRLVLKVWNSGYEIRELKGQMKRRIGLGSSKQSGIRRFILLVYKHMERRG